MEVDQDLLKPRILVLDETPSTNDTAKILLKDKCNHNFDVILAHHQSQGRGQRENTWISSAGQNLTVTIILSENILRRKTPWEVSMVTAISVRDTIAQESHCDCFIKWPNDIIIHDKKISGILIENIWKGENMTYSLLGIGVNLKQQQFGSLTTAISLLEFTSLIHSVEYYCLEICSKLHHYLNAYSKDEITEIYNRYLYRIFESNSIVCNGHYLPNEIIGVNSEGHLMTRDVHGSITSNHHPETRILLKTSSSCE